MNQFTQQLDNIPDAHCQCHASSQTPESSRKLFGNTWTHLSVDKTEGRFGEIATYSCLECGTKFIEYRMENPPFKNSSRWFIGVATDTIITRLKYAPEKAIPYFQELDWFIYGGSFFGTNGRYGKGTPFTMF